jgi:hypothetical protein
VCNGRGETDQPIGTTNELVSDVDSLSLGHKRCPQVHREGAVRGNHQQKTGKHEAPTLNGFLIDLSSSLIARNRYLLVSYT